MELVHWCRQATARGEAVVVSFLVAAGMSPDAAIAVVRLARGPRALETIAQEDFVVLFALIRQGRR